MTIKHDDGKERWSLVPFTQLRQVVKALTLGSQKYADNNWKTVPNAKDRYFSAAMRHLTQWWEGEKQDKETGLSHLAHAVANILFLMWFDDRENQ